MSIIQIDVTNACERKCANCTHLVHHCPNTWFMDLDVFGDAVASLSDFPGVVGIIGGNPPLHPRIEEMVRHMARVREPGKRGFWTSGGKNWPELKAKYNITLSGGWYLNENLHDSDILHQPVLVAVKDVVDEETAKRLIDRCWINLVWSASITPKGCYLCEVAACRDMAEDKNVGLPIEPGWWKKPVSAFQKQIDAFCGLCGCPVPLHPRRDTDEKDDISVSNLDALADVSPRVQHGDYFRYDHKRYRLKDWDNERWTPNKYLVKSR